MSWHAGSIWGAYPWHAVGLGRFSPAGPRERKLSATWAPFAVLGAGPILSTSQSLTPSHWPHLGDLTCLGPPGSHSDRRPIQAATRRAGQGIERGSERPLGVSPFPRPVFLSSLPQIPRHDGPPPPPPPLRRRRGGLRLLLAPPRGLAPPPPRGLRYAARPSPSSRPSPALCRSFFPG